jgi:Xaa-Pro aminopeptidase
LGFDTLTLCPIDRRLIDEGLLDAEERAWVDAYHARVEAELAPLVAEARGWLERMCRPLSS